MNQVEFEMIFLTLNTKLIKLMFSANIICFRSFVTNGHQLNVFVTSSS